MPSFSDPPLSLATRHMATMNDTARNGSHGQDHGSSKSVAEEPIALLIACALQGAGEYGSGRGRGNSFSGALYCDL